MLGHGRLVALLIALVLLESCGRAAEMPMAASPLGPVAVATPSHASTTATSATSATPMVTTSAVPVTSASSPAPSPPSQQAAASAPPTAQDPVATASPVRDAPTPAAIATPVPLLGIQPVHDPGLVAVPLQVPAAFRTGAFAQDHTVNLPPGFHISVFASDLASARGLALAPDGTVFVTLMDRGSVAALPDPQHTGTVAQVITVVSGLQHPHGIAFHGWDMYVGETTRVERFQLDPATLQVQQRNVIVSGLPSDGEHTTRTVHVGPDQQLYVSIGSSCNACVESDPRRAAIMRYHLDGTNGQLFARGMRNAVGFTFQPGTGLLWATVNGRDNLGDNIPGEDVTVVRQGDNFGWPYCYGDRVLDPELGQASVCATTTLPTVQIQAHSAPLGAAFAPGAPFPAADQGNLFVSLHGSWNRSAPTGYKVVQVVLEHDLPVRVDDFATGWLLGSGAWGRPVDVVAGADGSLYVSDDAAHAVYRIWFGDGVRGQ